VAIAVSVAAFGVSWWVCQEVLSLDVGVSVGVAGAVLAVAVAVAGWWATREPSGDSGSDAAGSQVVQQGQAGRDVNIAGRDQSIFNYSRRDE
jgi:hypothetical protein